MKYGSNDEEVFVEWIACHSDYRGKGIGSKLIQRGLRHAAAQGAAHTFLEVASDNLPALALYTRHGFVQAGRRKAYYKRANAPPVDAVMMKASLTEGHTPD